MTLLTVIEAGARVEIGACRLDTDADIALAEARPLLNADERTRAASLVFGCDQDRFVRARGYLRRRLGGHLGLPPQDVPLATAPGGKPFVEGYEIAFNLSHSGDVAVLAVTSGRHVGIDLEMADRSSRLEDQLEGLADMCLNREEQDALWRAPEEDRVICFLSDWTAKEARMKLTGEGLMLEPLAIALELRDGRPVGYAEPRAPEAALRWIELPYPGAICCLAVGREAAQ